MLELKVALRNLWRNKMYSLSNIVGLATGMGVYFVVLLYVYNERTYDCHIPSHKQIYRVQGQFDINGQKDQFASTGIGLGPLLKKEFSYINNYTRLRHIDENILFKSSYTKQYEGAVAVADSNFFQVFDIGLIAGDPGSCLSKPQSMVITESFAKKFFGDSKPLGQHISTNNYEYTVTGIIPDWPSNTHHKFSVLISAFLDPLNDTNYIKSLWKVYVHTFLKFDDQESADKLMMEFPVFYDRYMSDLGGHLGGNYQIQLARLDKIHFTENYDYDRPTGNRASLYIFSTIGMVILLLALINYVNMSTARGIKRAREISMRKVLGSPGNDIMSLIITESVVLSLLALFLAFVIVEVFLELSPLNSIVNKDLSLDFIAFPFLWWLPLLLALLVGIIGGLYPAFSLRRVPTLFAFNRIDRENSKTGIKVRKALVGFQCMISVAVVIAAVFMYRQMEYVNNKDLGFNREDILLVSVPDSITLKRIPELREKLAQSENVLASAMANSVLGNSTNKSLFDIQKENGRFERKVVDFMNVGKDYLRTMEIEMVEGMPFSSSGMLGNIYEPVIVNEMLVKEMKWDAPIGKKISWGFDREGVANYRGEVIGIVRNFNSHSLHENYEPMIIFYDEHFEGILHLRLKSNRLIEALNEVESSWVVVNPGSPFQFSFLNKDLKKLYEEEQKQSRLTLFLTYLTIFVSLLGVAGMASFTSGLRTKDIGVRKVLGANPLQLVNLVFSDMFMIVLLSVIIALPLSYLFIKTWLTNFAFIAAINSRVFWISAIIAILLIYLIVGYYTLKVLRTKPVETLKYD